MNGDLQEVYKCAKCGEVKKLRLVTAGRPLAGCGADNSNMTCKACGTRLTGAELISKSHGSCSGLPSCNCPDCYWTHGEKLVCEFGIPIEREEQK